MANPYHDDKGRFASGPGGSGGSNPQTAHVNHDWYEKREAAASADLKRKVEASLKSGTAAARSGKRQDLDEDYEVLRRSSRRK